ncbi:3252_t:CDS:2 [Racocetra fulgida]|uniref:3252_t:CDS:1 n=1 Tax=Racocetra fulgida TaxID=60492 RepID=A0A9N9FWX8_9GLOM|nr:3252_t:CDS:2 [Racocetra fulgida]
MANIQDTKINYYRGTCFKKPYSAITNYDVPSEIETYDLTIPKSPEIANSVTFKSDEERISSDNEDVEHEYNYGVFIKLENGTSLPAKWYTVKVSAVDELLSEIHTNVETLTRTKSIEASNYRIAFKPEKATGADNDLNIAFKNKNRIPKTFNLSSKESIMASNVLEIRKANHCKIHNRPCINKDGAKENHIEITFMMLSIWASEIAIATPTEPPTHPLFAYQHSSKTKASSLLTSPLQSNLIQQPECSGQLYAVPLFYNQFQMFSPYIPSQIYETPFQTSIQIPSQSATSVGMTLPTISNFLKQVDENENFEKCGVDTIGAQETLRHYAAKYNTVYTLPHNSAHL